MPKIFIQGLEHYYELVGQGIPLVFVHGAFADARLWQPQFEVFASKYQVLRYDLRGNGRTGNSDLANYTISTYADDLVSLLDALRVDSPIICGLSMGGVIAQALAVRYPERPKALILASTSVSASLTLSEKLFRYLLFPHWIARLTIHSFGIERFTWVSFWLAQVLWGKHWLSHDEAVHLYVKQSMLQMNSREFLKIWGAIYSFNLLPLERITCPTLVLNGELESKGMLRHTKEILRRIPQAQARVIPAACHALNLDNPEAFNLVLENFLDRFIG